MSQLRILLATGGTGGHIYPAIALAEELMEKHAVVLFAGGQLSSNPFFLNSQFQFKNVDCGKLYKSPWLSLKAMAKVCKGVCQSIKILRKFKPSLVVGFGSYYTFPVLMAAKLLQIPLFLHEANGVPGKVNRIFAPFAETIWVNFPISQLYFKTKSFIAGLPLRSQFNKGVISKEEARIAFQLDPNRITLLVFGGSQGSKRINQLFSEAAIFHLLDLLPEFQVIHITGTREDAELSMERYVSRGIPAYVRPFEKK